MMDMKGMARMTNDEASAFLGGSVYYMYSVQCILGGSVNDPSSAASPRQNAVKPLTDDCNDGNSKDDPDEGSSNEKDNYQKDLFVHLGVGF